MFKPAPSRSKHLHQFRHLSTPKPYPTTTKQRCSAWGRPSATAVWSRAAEHDLSKNVGKRCEKSVPSPGSSSRFIKISQWVHFLGSAQIFEPVSYTVIIYICYYIVTYTLVYIYIYPYKNEPTNDTPLEWTFHSIGAFRAEKRAGHLLDRRRSASIGQAILGRFREF